MQVKCIMDGVVLQRRKEEVVEERRKRQLEERLAAEVARQQATPSNQADGQPQPNTR